MLVLRFNYQKFYEDLLQAIADGANEAMQHFLNDAKSGLKAKDQELEPAVIDAEKNKIVATCVFYAQSILESYGRGRQMDMSNEYLSEYFGNTSLGWNPLRTDKRIVGRKEGTYTNFLGETAYSKGEKAGVVTSINVGQVVPPSYGIQNAEKKLERGVSENGYVMRILKSHAEQFLQGFDPSNYFYNEDASV